MACRGRTCEYSGLGRILETNILIMTLFDKLDQTWDLMRMSPRLKGVSLDFTRGFFLKQEGYKYEIHQQAKKAFNTKAIKAAKVGDGTITRIAVECLQTALTKGTGILVDWRKIDTLDKEGSDQRFETAVQHLAAGPSNEEYPDLFTRLASAKNSSFQVAAFLFFSQDQQRFLPISQDRFDLALDYLNTGVVTSRGNGDSYAAYLTVCKEVSQWLMARNAKTVLGLQDAHSFLFWLGYLIKYKELGEAAGAPLPSHQSEPSVEERVKSEPIFRVDDQAINNVLDAQNFTAYFGVEGKRIYAIHVSYERDPELVRVKKNLVMGQEGRLCCEACGFDFAEAYGHLGDGFIECHHKVPVSKRLPEGLTTELDDLALLCSNCHRMIHRCEPMLSVEQLKELLSARRFI